MKLLVFAASHRKDSLNRKLAQVAANHVKTLGAQVDFAEYAEFDMPLYNDEITTSTGVPDSAKGFSRRVAGMQGIIISSPEYNWSYPGTLKNIIDWTSRTKPNPLAGKTVLLMSATPGNRGGITGLQHLKTSLEALQLFAYPKVFPLGQAEKMFDVQGALTEPKQQRALFALLDEYVTFTQKLGG